MTALRTITRIQDADDIPAVGAGVDGEALAWHNATQSFVFVTTTAGGAALLAAGNTFTVAPQTVAIDADAHQGYVSRAHSTTQTGNYFEAQRTTGGVVGGIAPAPTSSNPNAANESCLFGGVVTPVYGIHFSYSKTNAAAAYISGVFGTVFNSTQSDAGHYVLFIGSGGDNSGNNQAQLWRFNADGSAQATMRSASAIPLSLCGASAQTANLLELHGLSSTSTERQLAALNATFVVSTDASYTSRFTLSAKDFSASREVIRGESDGSAGRLSFYGASAVAKQTITGSKGANAALASLLTALANLGLITDSTT